MSVTSFNILRVPAFVYLVSASTTVWSKYHFVAHEKEYKEM